MSWAALDALSAGWPQDDLMPRYAELVYNGFWFTPEREALQALVDKTQAFCNGAFCGLKLDRVVVW